MATPRTIFETRFHHRQTEVPSHRRHELHRRLPAAAPLAAAGALPLATAEVGHHLARKAQYARADRLPGKRAGRNTRLEDPQHLGVSACLHPDRVGQPLQECQIALLEDPVIRTATHSW